MFLSNISMNEDGADHLLGKDKQKGSVLENLLGMFSYFKTSQMFDFVANIFANVSSNKPGRQWMVECSTVIPLLFKNLDDKETNAHRMKHLLEVVRNICFEYDKYEKDFL